jgi:GNAT superfamily N-acetyltransferase
MITFQRAILNDAETIVRLKLLAFAEDAKLYGSGPPGYDSLDDARKSIQRANYYLILKNEKPIGGFSLYEISPDHMRVGALFIDPAFHNQGIGTQSIAFIEKTYPHIRKWSLETPYKSYRNHHFYEKNGFVKVGETLPEPNGFYLFLYEKNIFEHKH